MSLTISLQFPTGRYVAAGWSDKNSIEWPPHPARFCLGLLDALHRAGNPADEREALLWLCEQGAPEIALPDEAGVDQQVHGGVFVPQNTYITDKKATVKEGPFWKGESWGNIFYHPRKERAFPVVYLDSENPSVFFHWPGAEPSEKITSALESLLARLPRFGHSSSLVIASLQGSPNQDSDWQILEPLTDKRVTSTPSHSLRVPWPGLMESAEKEFDSESRAEEIAKFVHKGKGPRGNSLFKPAASPRPRHDAARQWQGYVESKPPSATSGPWDSGILVLKQEPGGSRLGIQSTWQISDVLHKTLLDRWSRDPSRGPVPSWISGHAENSADPARHCHLAIFPLAFVDHQHADGHLLGLGLALPDPEELRIDKTRHRLDWQRALGALLEEEGKVELTARDKKWSATFAPLVSPLPALTLQPSRWTRASRLWKSVTPVILNRHPKPKLPKTIRPNSSVCVGDKCTEEEAKAIKEKYAQWRESCRKIVRQSCAQLGLPEPVRVEPSVASTLNGVPPAPAFVAPKPRPNRPARFHIHAEIEFAEPVAGPLLLGAGRYRGYGLFLPVKSEQHETDQTQLQTENTDGAVT